MYLLRKTVLFVSWKIVTSNFPAWCSLDGVVANKLIDMLIDKGHVTMDDITCIYHKNLKPVRNFFIRLVKAL